MTPARGVVSKTVTSEKIDLRTRQRIAANLRLLHHQHRFESDAAMGKALGVTRQAMTRYLSGERTVGLDVAIRVHRKLGVSLDWLVDRDPPQEWWDRDRGTGKR